MPHKQHSKYIHITPAAPGWFAVFNRGGKVEKTVLVAWAVKEMEPEKDYIEDLENDGYTSWDKVTDVVGLTLDSGLDGDFKYQSCSETLCEIADRWCKFLGYDYPGCNVDWEKTLKEKIKEKHDKE